MSTLDTYRGKRTPRTRLATVVNSGGYLHRMVQSALQKIFLRDNVQRPMFHLQHSTFAAITLTVLERFSRNSAGRILSGRGTSSRDEKSNKQHASRMRPMQTLVNTDFKQANQKDHKNGRSTKYIHVGKSPGEMPRQIDHPIQTHYFKFKFQIRPVYPSA